ncbi:MAG TPA: lysophospholipid acyltransferase family protein [Polyangiaceae bacterium]|jgi:1-acyl-sn-glycerol-3-phosphate acyltransferase
MDRHTALAKVTDLAPRAFPFALRLWDAARRSLDRVTAEWLGEDFEERVERLRLRYVRTGGDPFGLDPTTARKAMKLLSFFHRVYFRTECHGLQNLPPGRMLLVANHAGQVPIDAAIIGCALFLDATPERVVRAMVERWAGTLPFVSTFFSRVGQVVGLPENARRLLERDEVLLAFPEGVRGISKPITRRYQLEEFGTGFMRLALETSSPIVPVAVIGSEEQYVSLGNLTGLARVLGIPAFPLLPQLLIPGGQLPLPLKYRLYFGEPLRFSGNPNDDDRAISDKVWTVRQTIQNMVNQGLNARRHLFY